MAILVLTVFLWFGFSLFGAVTPYDVAAGGIVLLENRQGALPLAAGERVACFGDVNFTFRFGGEGSGKVNKRGCVTPPQAAAAEPLLRMSPSALAAMPKISIYYPGEEALRQFQLETDTALIFISRVGREGVDRQDIPGDLRPLDSEVQFIRRLRALRYRKIILILNTAGQIDGELCELADAVLFCGFPGEDGARAIVDVLTGKVNPDGRLPFTWSKRAADFPFSPEFSRNRNSVDYIEDIFVGYRYFTTFDPLGSRVKYPFGYGLSYTRFAVKSSQVNHEEEGAFVLHATVVNTGAFAGRETLQLYCAAPQGKLAQPALKLVGFARTALIPPGGTAAVSIRVEPQLYASFDDTGVTGYPNSWLLEPGDYRFYLATNAFNALRQPEAITTLHLAQTRVLEVCPTQLQPSLLTKRLRTDGSFELLNSAGSTPAEIARPPRISQRHRRPLSPLAGYEDSRKHLSVDDVEAHPAFFEAFIRLQSDEMLIRWLGGQASLFDPKDGIGIIGGDGTRLTGFLPGMETIDGPAGIKSKPSGSWWPCSTLVACNWDPQMAQEMAASIASEGRRMGYSVWLAPAVNIQRHPLNGRNFEYFSEDPLLSGRLGGAMVIGAQSQGMASAPKHFFANNRELYRSEVDSRVSWRAAREIYLRAFEYTVRTGKPWCIMSSYGLVNGIKNSQNKGLLNGILRGEWGFSGLVLTDWENDSTQELEIPAGNDVKMPIGDPERLKAALESGELSRQELELSARNLLRLILRVRRARRFFREEPSPVKLRPLD